MRFSAPVRSLIALGSLLLLTALHVPAQTGAKKFVFTTKSKEAREAAEKVIWMIESMSVGPDTLPLAQKAVAADPQFAFGHYLVATFTPPPQPPQPGAANPHMAKALELAKTASDGERRYIQAVALVRTQKPVEGAEMLRQLSVDYPGERMV
ncbi:MAG: hypothetical protein LC800_10310, partial [Acidobacteria bacterium]|nr:hypothetical protein [Acidobacteriota bacterium]